MKPGEIDPKILLAAQVEVERDLSILTGPELLKRYATEEWAAVFKQIVKRPVTEVAVDHNPYWHYILQTWYRPPRFRKLLYPPRHRDEVAKAVLLLATGELDDYDGVHQSYPRRALKSFNMKMMADWLPKRHKIVDDIDILVLYSHNLDRRAKAALESIKNMNRHNAYIARHFGETCMTLTGRPACFTIPKTEWGEKEQWNWPCRDEEFQADEKSMTSDAAASRKAGGGFNYILLDDWEDEESRKSDSIREHLADRYDQVRQLAAPPFKREWSGGTPYCIASLYRPMLEEKHEDGKQRYFVVRCPALDEKGDPNFPSIPRLSVASLAKERANEVRRRGTDRFWFLQYQLDPTQTGEQAMSFEMFTPITPEEYAKKFAPLPKFRAVYCDPAWKGDHNHQEGSDAAIGTIDTYSIAGQIDNVLLDLYVSNSMESDDGADEILRQMMVWHSTHYVIEQQADKPMVGLIKRVWKTTPRDSRSVNPPRYIDVGNWSKKAKNDRISTVAGQAKMGHWYYLTSIPKHHLRVLEKTANEYPATPKRDTLDMMANANAEEVLTRWVPVAIPEKQEVVEREPPAFVTRYTGLTAVMVH